MVDLVTHNSNALTTQSSTRQENYAAALSELLKHAEWNAIQEQLKGKDANSDNKCNAWSCGWRDG